MRLPLEFLPTGDADRASRTLHKLFRHDIPGWALTGGLAVELRWTSLTRKTSVRSLNDVDFITNSFDSIPASLAQDFIFRHVHPLDPPGKTLLQIVDVENAVRVDVFRAYGAEMSRSAIQTFSTVAIRLVSIEDLVARAARLCLDLAANKPIPAAHASDFLRLAELIDPKRLESVWLDHRKPRQPQTFTEAYMRLKDVIPASREFLITRSYSTDIEQICSRCRETLAFRLADPRVMLSLLGYC
jgi:hypothetical protein